MATATVLNTSSEVHAAIKRILGSPSPSDRRVVVVAYLGAGAESYLPHPEGLHIICNPQPGATDPVVVRRLLGRKARLQFSDRLHMKVYWSRSRGCVITSANASENALGASSLKEAGVLLPRGRVNIDRLINYAKPTEITEEAMMRLERATRTIDRAPLGQKPTRERKARHASFIEWYQLPHPSPWKLGWSNDYREQPAREAIEKTEAEHGKPQPFNWMAAEPRTVVPSDWLLSFEIEGQRITQIGWFYVDFLVRYAKSERPNKWYSLEAIQVDPPRRCPDPPFPITPGFRLAFRRAIKAFGIDRIMDRTELRPPKRLLDMIVDAWPK